MGAERSRTVAKNIAISLYLDTLVLTRDVQPVFVSIHHVFCGTKCM